MEVLDVAIRQRRSRGVIHHSDQGSKYTSLAFGIRCRETGVRPWMGSIGDASDNALFQSFFATLECDLLDRRRFRSQEGIRQAVFELIEGRNNPYCLHSPLGYTSAARYEIAAAYGA